MDSMRQTACFVVTVDNFAALFNCMPAGQTSDVMMAPVQKDSLKLVVAWCSVFGRTNRSSTVGLLLLQRFSVGLAVEYSHASFQCWILICMFAVLKHWRIEVLPVFDHLLILFIISWWTSAGKKLTSWLSVLFCFTLCRLDRVCSFPVRYLGKGVEFDCIGSWSLPLHLLSTYTNVSL